MAREELVIGDVGGKVHVRPSGDSTVKTQAVVLAMESTDQLIPGSIRGIRTDQASTGISTGRLTVTTPGTPVQIATTSSKSIALFALPANTKRCMVGDGNVKASDSLFQGIPIEPGSGVIIDISNTSLIWIDAVVGGEGVSWTVLT